jgi:16S rRNA (adenine1518-N6/adenine1519-N6)-dimethyltransferase
VSDYEHEDPRSILARHGLSPKSSMSQNFLVSQRAVRTIVAATGAKPGELVVELGPGLGTLTAALMATGAQVVAVERDRDMIRVLEAELVPRGLRVQPGDAAEVDYAPFAAESGGQVAVCGNLPYAVTGAIIRNLTEARPFISRAV